MNFNFKLTHSKSFELHGKHSTGILNMLQYINKFVCCNIFTLTSSQKTANINIKDINNSMIIISVLHMIMNTKHYNNKHIIETILNSPTSIIEDIIKIFNCSSSGVTLNLEITDHKVLDLLRLKQNTELIPVHHHPALDPIKSQIQLLHALYHNSYDELKEMYISSPFARQYFTSLCNHYQPGKYNVNCRVTIFPEELAGNNIVNLLKIITKCKDDNNIIEKVHDYAKECTMKLTEKELEAAFTTLAVYQLANINYRVLNECKYIANTISLAEADTSIDNCDILNKDVASDNEIVTVHTRKLLTEDIELKTKQSINKVGVDPARDDDDKVYLSNPDNLASSSNPLQVSVMKITGHTNLAFNSHLDDY